MQRTLSECQTEPNTQFLSLGLRDAEPKEPVYATVTLSLKDIDI